MDGFFSAKTFIRLLAAAVVLAAVIVLISERIENSRSPNALVQNEVTRIVKQTVVVTQLVERMVTQPGVPTSEIIQTPKQKITQTPHLTNTPVILSVLPDGLDVWCLPSKNTQTENLIPVTGLGQNDAIQAEREDGLLTVITQVKRCSFLISFNIPFPDGIHIQVKDLNPDPFIDETLEMLGGDPFTGYVNLDHYFIVDPPYWQVTYQVSVISPDGVVLWENPVVFKRSWQPAPCPDGRLPDPITLDCSTLPE